jgi:CheY-like chemotaxis protein
MAPKIEAAVSKQARLRCEFSPEPLWLDVDVAQLRQVVMNLVVNASEAIGDREGAIVLRTEAAVCGDGELRDSVFDTPIPGGRYGRLEVSDTGCGMDEETAERVFDPFFTTKFLGRGLGLPAVQGIVHGHRGALRITTRPGAGTTVSVLFPLSDQPTSRAEEKSESGERRFGGTVLLVDDEEFVRDVGERMLRQAGFDVLVAKDGREAVELFTRQAAAIACVLLDLTMPRMDGEETLEALRAIRPAVRAIVSSGYTEQQVSRRFGDRRPAGFIQKPYRYAELIGKLREVLA